MKSSKEQMKPFKGVYVIDFSRYLSYKENDIANTEIAKAIFLSYNISGAYVSNLIIDPPLRPEPIMDFEIEEE